MQIILIYLCVYAMAVAVSRLVSPTCCFHVLISLFLAGFAIPYPGDW